MMAITCKNSEGGAPRNLLEKIRLWDEAMQCSERYAKTDPDGPSEPWSPLYELADFD